MADPKHPDQHGAGSDPFGGDPFGNAAYDPFGADPFAGTSSDPFGQSEATAWPQQQARSSAPPPVAPRRARLPAQALPPPPSPPKRSSPVPQRPAVDASKLPDTVAFAGWLFAGIGAVMLTLAIAVAMAIPEFDWYYGSHTWLAVTAATGGVLLGAAIIWQAIRIVKHRRLARPVAVIGCGLTLSLAAFGLIAGPGSAVAWFTHLTQAGAVTAAVTAVATGVLLFLPPSNAYLHRDAHKPPPPPTFAEIVNAAHHVPRTTAPQQHSPASGPPPAPRRPPASNPPAAPPYPPASNPPPAPRPADFDPFS
ncbi:hypothetical protein [Mycobacterium sp. 1165178.9]|uniref:hypothetical protein n=1 Tax=Mycobacterium sp. 1165178.9 TaxID=1834070 RepID=UPI0007FE98A5|nr:hypothetical protein [Mycobacterium sp. 1165178.9]OBK92485.1 hypothetical protein A5652_10230 [Mycobacterium sp. 1165178.9]